MVDETLTIVLLEPRKTVAKLNTQPQDANNTEGEVGQHQCDQKEKKEVSGVVHSARLCVIMSTERERGRARDHCASEPLGIRVIAQVTPQESSTQTEDIPVPQIKGEPLNTTGAE